MALFVTTDADGNITQVSEMPFNGSVAVDYETVSYKGRIYKKGTEPKPTPDEVADFKLVQIDTDTSAEIIGGFTYTVDSVDYHFSYDSFDQQNFSDTANMATLSKMGVAGIQTSVPWNAYKNWANGEGELVQLTFTADTFLELYMKGTLAHKANCMLKGGTRKAAVRDALTNGLTAEQIAAI